MIALAKLQEVIDTRIREAGSQANLAAAIGIDATIISEVRRGIRKPSDRVLAALGYRRVVRYEKVGGE